MANWISNHTHGVSHGSVIMGRRPHTMFVFKRVLINYHVGVGRDWKCEVCKGITHTGTRINLCQGWCPSGSSGRCCYCSHVRHVVVCDGCLEVFLNARDELINGYFIAWRGLSEDLPKEIASEILTCVGLIPFTI